MLVLSEGAVDGDPRPGGVLHDSAAALIADRVLIAAAQEEQFARNNHRSGFPKNAVEYCLAGAGIELDQVDFIAF